MAGLPSHFLASTSANSLYETCEQLEVQRPVPDLERNAMNIRKDLQNEASSPSPGRHGKSTVNFSGFKFWRMCAEAIGV